jgi:mRNA-degrading endonuclease RelE of RelBE toxin-antitoxin system
MKSILSMRLKKTQKLPGELFQRIITHIKSLAGVGDYRIIYEVDDSVRVVKVMRVRDRREAYR